MTAIFHSFILSIVKQVEHLNTKRFNTIPIEYEKLWFAHLFSSGLVQ